jgi:hypothetical protein
MNRRAFFAALAAPFIVRLLPKREPTILEVIDARMIAAQIRLTTALVTEVWGPKAGCRTIQFKGETLVEDKYAAHWHGGLPFVTVDLSKLSPWATYSKRLS